MKKERRRGQDRRKGTRNLTVLKPYVAPRVRPRMRRTMDANIRKAPGRSSRLNFSLPEVIESLRSPLVLGTRANAANAKGHMTMD